MSINMSTALIYDPYNPSIYELRLLTLLPIRLHEILYHHGSNQKRRHSFPYYDEEIFQRNGYPSSRPLLNNNGE